VSGGGRGRAAWRRVRARSRGATAAESACRSGKAAARRTGVLLYRHTEDTKKASRESFSTARPVLRRPSPPLVAAAPTPLAFRATRAHARSHALAGGHQRRGRGNRRCLAVRSASTRGARYTPCRCRCC
jgi:hypothetical protein